jgi:hypothetical protein
MLYGLLNDRSGAVHQKHSQIPVAALRNTEQAIFAA